MANEETECDLPVEIGKEETVARLIISPYHVNGKKKPRPAAFKPTRNSDQVSLVRFSHMGDDFCKAKGSELASTKPKEPTAIYLGVCLGKVGEINDLGFLVEDSRVHYCGHGHISIGIVLPPEAEPLPSEDLAKLEDICRLLLSVFPFTPDIDGMKRALVT